MPSHSVKRADDVPAKAVTAGRGTRYQVLVGPDDGGHGFVLRRFTMEPGGGMPLHTNRVEHEQYVLAGEADVVIGDATHRVRAGDAVFIPAGVPHSYATVGDAPFQFLCVVPNAPDEVTLVDPAAS